MSKAEVKVDPTSATKAIQKYPNKVGGHEFKCVMVKCTFLSQLMWANNHSSFLLSEKHIHVFNLLVASKHSRLSIDEEHTTKVLFLPTRKKQSTVTTCWTGTHTICNLLGRKKPSMFLPIREEEEGMFSTYWRGTNNQCYPPVMR